MDSSSTDNKGSLGRLLDELKRDKKKTAVLAVLTVVALVMGIRALGSGTPARAKAMVAAPPLSSVGSTASAQSVSTPAANADLTSSGELLAEQRREQYIFSIDRRINRDIFAVKLDQFPLQASVVVQPVASEPASQPAVDPAVAERQETLAQAETLALQSTICGKVPTAIINDRVLTTGESIQGFTVVDILDQACVVRKNDVVVTLNLKKR